MAPDDPMRAPNPFSRFNLAVLVTVLALAPARPVRARPAGPTPPRTSGVERPFLNANSIAMSVSDSGSFALDPSTGQSEFFYPNGTDSTLLFAGGLWLAGNVQGGLRTALAEYTWSFGAGPILGGAAVPPDPRYHVYRVTRADTAGTAEWMRDAVPLGAPTTPDGFAPGLVGSQTTWCVYNDASQPLHDRLRLTRTAPLGIEVRQTSWEHHGRKAEEHALFLAYDLYNRGANPIDSLFVGLWGDCELGGATDDFVGSDSARALVYAYNADEDDLVYGAATPALGFALWQGPYDAANAETLGVYSTNMYIGGDDPDAPLQVRQLLLGRKRDGSDRIRRTDGSPAKFVFDGDPVAGTGWLDTLTTDRRFLITATPFSLAAGDSQRVVFVVLVGDGGNRLASITDLRASLDSLRAGIVDGPEPPGPPLPVPALSLATLGNPGRGSITFTTAIVAGRPYRLEIHDVLGRFVIVAASGSGTGAPQTLVWNGATSHGPARPGVYFARLVAGDERAVARAVLLPE